MYKIIILVIFITPVALLAQTNLEFSFGSFGGYENNIFNVPSVWTGEDENSQLQSGMFVLNDLKLGVNIDTKRHQYALIGRGTHTLFPGIDAANLFNGKIDSKYSFSPQSKLKFYLKNHWLTKQRNNTIDETEEFRTPRSYHHLNGLIGLEYKINKKLKLSPEFFAARRMYSPTEESSLTYNEIGVTLKATQRIKLKQKQRLYLNNKTTFFNRYYLDVTEEFDESFNEEEEEELEEEVFITENRRHWQYISNTFDLRFKLKNDTRLKWGLQLEQRNDLSQNRFGYREYESFLEWSKTIEHWFIKFRASYANRQFTDLIIDNANATHLVYNFVRGSMTINYQLNDKWVIESKFNASLRNSNNPSTATYSYREYFNYFTQLGLRLSL